MSLSCPNCGSSPDPRDHFCGKCGQPVRVPAARTAGSTATSANGRAPWSGWETSRISQAAPADEADQPAYPQRPVRDHREASRDVPASTWPSGGARSSWPFAERSAPMGYPQGNAGFPGRNAAFPGLSDGGPQRESAGQPTAAPENGSGQVTHLDVPSHGASTGETEAQLSRSPSMVSRKPESISWLTTPRRHPRDSPCPRSPGTPQGAVGQRPGSHLWLMLTEFAGIIVVPFALASVLIGRAASG